jgi:hypothetical protein
MQYVDERRQEFKVMKVESEPTPPIFRAGFIVFDSEEWQEVLKMLDADERFSRGYPWRAPSPYDPAATPRRFPLRPSRFWLDGWAVYVSDKTKEADGSKERGIR